MQLLSLSRGKFAIIDDVDFEKVGHFKWHALKARQENFYAARNVGKGLNRTLVLLHDELLGIKNVDHKNGDGLDCRRENLRPATSQQNSQAFRRKISGTTSQFRGVSWCNRDQKWVAHIGIGRKQFHLGYFVYEDAAAWAHDAVAKANGFFQESLNFPTSRRV